MNEDYNELKALFSSVLNNDNIEEFDDHSFFELGGDSIKAMKLVSEAKDIGYDITLEEIMSSQPVGSTENKNFFQKDIQRWQKQISGEIELGDNLSTRTNTLCFKIFNFSNEKLEKCIEILCERHDVLRTVKEDNVYTIRSVEDFNCIDENQYIFNIRHENQYGVEYIYVDLDSNVSDIKSLQILFNDFKYYYSSLYDKEEFDIKPKTAPYTKWLEIQEKNKRNFAYYNNVEKNEIIESSNRIKQPRYNKFIKETIDIEKDINISDMFFAYQRLVLQIYGTENSYCMNYYNNKRIYEDDSCDFTNTVGNFVTISNNIFDKHNLLNVKDLFIKNEYKNIDITKEKTGFYYIDISLDNNQYCEFDNIIFDIYNDEKIFMIVYECDDKYTIELHCKELDTNILLEKFNLLVLNSNNNVLCMVDYGLVYNNYNEFKIILNKFSENNVERIYRLLDIQKGMLFHSLETKGSDEYKMQYAVKIDFYMDIQAVIEAINIISKKYRVLRTSIVYKDIDMPVQVVLKNRLPKIKVIDINGEITENEISNYAKKDLSLISDLEVDSLFNVTILNNYEGIVMIWNFHHIIVDGWSMPIIFNDFRNYYEMLIYGEDFKYSSSNVYEKYIDKVYSSDIVNGLDYWGNLLKGSEVTKVYPINGNKVAFSNEKEKCSAILDSRVKQGINDLSIKLNITENTVLETAFGVLLQKYNYCDDIVFGKIVSGRNQDVNGIGDEVGLCVNTIPVRVINNNNLFSELLKNQHQSNKDATKYHFCSISQISQHIGYNPINILYVYENFYNVEKISGDFQNIYIKNLRDDTNYDITVIVNNHDKLKVEIVYNSSIYFESEITRLVDSFIKILETIIIDEEIKVSDIEFISKNDKDIILNNFNNTEVKYEDNKSVVDSFLNNVGKYGNRNAIRYYDEILTYEQLESYSSQFANTLVNQGVKKGDNVAVIAHKNIKTIICFIAILKVGGAYVPIDPLNPDKRIEYIINDCEANVVINTEHDLLFDKNSDFIIVNTLPNDIVYMMYTSGTLGKPKAVMAENIGITRLVKCSDYVKLDKNTCILQTSSMAFDASTFEIWGTLLNGGLLCLADSEDILNSVKLDNLVRKYSINTMWLTSSLFNQLVNEKNNLLQTLKYLLIGGEKLSEKHVSLFLKNNKDTSLINGYGPTENTTFTTAGRIDSDFKKITIGKPIPNTSVYIMNGNNLCPMGIYGELCTGGLGVTQGYYKRADLTEESFVDNPFHEGKMYRTKDVARWLENGEIEYLGRMDNQAKIRGYRVELDEIKETIEKYEGIIECVIVLDDDKNIRAYYIADKEISKEEIFSWLKKNLPNYMIPKYYLQVDKFALNQNGKLSKKDLPEITEPIKRQYAKPRNESEVKMVNIFKNILHIDNMGINDDFIELGGHSLMAVRMANTIESEFGVRLELQTIMEKGTPSQLLEIIFKSEITKKNVIKKSQYKEFYLMTSVQKRMFTLNKINKGNINYNIPIVLEFEKSIDVDKMIDALHHIINRHEALRTIFKIHDGEMVQQIVDVNINVNIYENVNLNELLTEFIKVFDLENELPFRVCICRNKSDFLIIDMHHIISDGISSDIIIRELLTLYNGVNLKEVDYQYRDYSEWLNKQLFIKEKEFWLSQFEDEIPILELPYDYSRNNKISFNGNTIFEDFLSENINKIAKRYQITEYVVFLAAWVIILNKYSCQEEIVIGTPVSGRIHNEIENTIGMFVNTIPLKVNICEIKRLGDLLIELSDLTYNAFENQEYPLMDLIDELDISRDNSRQPLFDVLFSMRDDLYSNHLEKQGVKIIQVSNKTSKFDISVEVSNCKKGYIIKVEYCTDLFKKETIRRLLNDYILLLNIMINNLDKKIEDIEIINEEDRDKILNKFNDTDKKYEDNSCVQAIFTKNCDFNANDIALVDQECKYSYSKLNELSDIVAVSLINKGVRSGDAVAILADKKADTIIAILGIIKAGALYIPIDPTASIDIIKFVIDDSGAKVIIGTDIKLLLRNSINAINIHDLYKINIKKIERMLLKFKHEKVLNDPLDAAYYMYTSGTTGKPKATIVMHKNILRLVKNCNYVELNNDTKILQTGSLAFDASTFEIWGTLLNGGCLHIVSNDILTRSEELIQYIDSNGINTMWFTSSLFNQMMENDEGVFDNLKYLLIGGEKLSKYHVKKFKQRKNGVKLINGYGPTENTTFTTSYEIPDDFDKIYIGKPISNTKVYIMKKNTLCGINVYGEICTTGDGVAKGYLHNDDLNNSKFVPNPFGIGTMYRTGDIARFLPDGNIEYLGRIDSQVKIRGYRVELAGIENALQDFPYITQATVVIDQEKNIKAYYVSESEIDNYELFIWLKQKLPNYMVPKYYMRISYMPLNKNGKLNYNMLPDNTTAMKNRYEKPANLIEEQLINLFKDVLNVDNIGTIDNFFDLGGHSLNATLLLNAIEKNYSVRLNISDVLDNPTPHQLSEFIKSREKDSVVVIPKAQHKEYYEMFSAQKRIYIMCQLDKNELLYNMPMTLKYKGKLDKQIVENSFKKIIDRHESLRTSYLMRDGKLFQKIIDIDNIEFLVSVSDGKDFVQPFNLDTPPLIRVSIVNGIEEDYLLIDVHHIASDGIGMSIIIGEFIKLYNYKQLMPISMQYKDYSEWMQGRELREQEEYWLQEFRNDIPILNLINDKKRQVNSIRQGKTITKELKIDASKSIEDLSLKYGVTDYMLLLSIATIVLGKYCYQEEFVIGSVAANRQYKELENIVGMFVNTIAIKTSFNKNQIFKEFLLNIKQTCINAYKNQEYQYEHLIDNLNVKREHSRNPMFDVMFVYQNGLSSEELNNYGFEYLDSDNKVAKFDLTININKKDGYIIKFEYDGSLFEETAISSMLNSYILLLEKADSFINERIGNISMLTKKDKDLILYNFNTVPEKNTTPLCIHHMFENHAEKDPNKIAIEFGDYNISYDQLNKEANRIAWSLIEKGIGEDDFVCILASRTPKTVIGLLGVLKAGAAYVPIDPEWPEERRNYVIRDSSAKVYLSDNIEIDVKNVEGINLGYISQEINCHNPNKECVADDLAYCIYTSGTTGKPKGVLIEHRGVHSLREYFIRNQNILKMDKVLQFSNFAFDASISELCMGVLSGNTMVMVSDEIKYDVKEFERFIDNNKIDVGIIPPQYQKIMKPTSLKTIISAGSETNNELIKRHGIGTVYSNDYGPTEATVCATYWKYNQDYTIPYRIPIGKPIYNKRIYIANNNNLCGIYEPGEICIAGDGLARGYLNNEELTNSKFASNSFYPGILYRSGDLGRWLPDGNVEFLGRIDEQVKVRGFRVDISEITNYINEIENIETSVVLPYKKNTEEVVLIAFYESNIKYSEIEIKNILAKKLASYMIPSNIICIEKIPIMISGKVNNRLLKEYYKEVLKKESRNITTIELTNSQRLVKNIWETVLECTVNDIDVNFFDIGGNSLNLFMVVQQLEESGIDVSISELYKYPTINMLCSEIIDKEVKFDDIIKENLAVNNVVILEGIRENKDVFSWKDLNCYYKPFGIVMEKYGKHYYDFYLLLLSFNSIYEKDGLFSSFSIENRQKEFEEFFTKVIQNDFGVSLNMELFSKLPDIDTFNDMIIENLKNDKPIIIAGDSSKLYYSADYLNKHHSHYFIIRGCDENKELWYILDSLHIDNGENPIYKRFVIPFDKLYESVVSYGDNLIVSQDEAYMFIFEKNSLNKQLTKYEILKSLLKQLINIEQDKSSCEYIDVGFMEFVFNNSQKLMQADEEDRSKTLTYISSLLNMKIVYFDTIKKLIKNFIDDQQVINEFDIKKNRIIKLWKDFNVRIWSIMGGEEVDVEMIKGMIASAIETEEQFRKKLISVIDNIKPRRKLENNINMDANNYFVNPLDAEVNLTDCLMEVHLNDDYSYDMWLDEANAVRLGKSYYNKGFSIETEIVISNEYEGSKFHDGIAIRIDNKTLFMFGIVCGDYNNTISIFCPNIQNHVLFETNCYRKKIKIKVELANDFVTFYIWDNLIWEIVKTIKYTGNLAQVELFTRTWEKDNHVARFENFKWS